MGMNDRSFIDKIDPTFSALTITAIHHYLLAWTTGGYRVLPEIGPGGRAQLQCGTRNINHAVNTAFEDVFHHLEADFCSSSQMVQAHTIGNIHSMICQMIHSTGTDPAMAQPQNS
jgi:hypothetical protein